eukprot:scaffold44586_cov511-Skeletonema_marinoi.AAC.1
MYMLWHLLNRVIVLDIPVPKAAATRAHVARPLCLTTAPAALNRAEIQTTSNHLVGKVKHLTRPIMAAESETQIQIKQFGIIRT